MKIGEAALQGGLSYLGIDILLGWIPVKFGGNIWELFERQIEKLKCLRVGLDGILPLLKCFLGISDTDETHPIRRH